MNKQQPEALRLANVCSNLTRYSMDAHLIAAELRTQHARITDLEARLEAIGAGGVSGPLIGQPQAMPDLSQLTERGAKAWAGVDAQGLREGFTAADMATVSAQGFRDGVASVSAQAADSVLEDAARWNEVLRHVGAAYHLGGQHFTLNTLRIRDQMYLLRGSVAQHFTACIDDSRAARKQEVRDGLAAILPELFREALAWGMTYGPEIPAHQWDQMRESMVNQYVSRAARAPAESVPAVSDLPPLPDPAQPDCPTGSDHGAVGNILTAEPCPDCTRWNVQPARADSVLEDAAWMPLTPELLTAIESGDLGNRFWIAAHNNNEPQIGVYEWRQGRNPHGFNSDLSRYGASEITHVLPYKPPALPAAPARKQGASHDR